MENVKNSHILFFTYFPYLPPCQQYKWCVGVWRLLGSLWWSLEVPDIYYMWEYALQLYTNIWVRSTYICTWGSVIGGPSNWLKNYKTIMKISPTQMGQVHVHENKVQAIDRFSASKPLIVNRSENFQNTDQWSITNILFLK